MVVSHAGSITFCLISPNPISNSTGYLTAHGENELAALPEPATERLRNAPMFAVKATPIVPALASALTAI